jgi:HAD superfamily hydrolase (TIGR01509 family)
MASKLEAVIFDLYETLITHFDPDWRPGRSVAEQLGLDSVEFSRAWKDVYDRRNSGSIGDYRSALREAARSLGCTPDEELLVRLDRAHTAGHERLFRRIEPDILAMLEALRGSSIKLGLISNTTPEEVAGWDLYALAPCFDEVVFSYQVGLVKPDERIYQLACEHLGVSTSAALFVGDGGDSELGGASKAGLEACWALWFLEQWRDWEERFERSGLSCYRRLRSPAELVDLVAGRMTEGN